MVKTKSKKTKKSVKTWRDKLLVAIKGTAVSFIALFYLAWFFNMDEGQAMAFYAFLLAMIWALFIMGGVYIVARVLGSPKRKK